MKARDNCKAATQCLERHGMPTFQVDRPPVPAPLQLHPHTSLKPRLIRAPRTEAMESVYSTHAREGFAYWFNDRKITGGGCGKLPRTILTYYMRCNQSRGIKQRCRLSHAPSSQRCALEPRLLQNTLIGSPMCKVEPPPVSVAVWPSEVAEIDVVTISKTK